MQVGGKEGEEEGEESGDTQAPHTSIVVWRGWQSSIGGVGESRVVRKC